MELISKIKNDNIKHIRLDVYDPKLGITLSYSADENIINNYPDIICQICLGIVINPVSCGKCEQLYCNICIREYSKYSEKCPNRCLLQIKPIHRVLRNILNKIKLKCHFFYKGCKVISAYDRFLEHINTCEYGPYLCLTKGCNYIDIMSKVVLHTTFCSYFNKIKKLNSNSELISIYNQPSRTCSHCKEVIDKNYFLHNFTCEKQIVTCELCHQEITLKELKSHEYDNSCLVKYYQNTNEELEKRNREIEKKLVKKTDYKVIKNERFVIKVKAKSKVDLRQELNKDQESKILKSLNNSTNFNDNEDACLNDINNLEIINRKQRKMNKNTNNLINLLQISHKNYLLSIDNNKLIFNDINKGNEEEILIINELEGLKTSVFNTFTLEINGVSSNILIIGDIRGSVFIIHFSENKNKLNYLFKKKIQLFNFALTALDHLKGYNGDTYLAVGCSSGGIKIINITEGTITTQFYCKKPVVSLIHVQDGFGTFYLISASSESFLRIWNINDEKLHSTIQAHSDSIWVMIKLSGFKPEKSHFATGSGDKKIKIWNFGTGKEEITLTGHKDSVCSLAYINNNPTSRNLLISGSYDGEIKLWNIVNTQCLYSFCFHIDKINNLLFWQNNYNYNLISSSEDYKILECNLRAIFD